MSMENKDNNMEYEDYETELNDLNLQLSGNSTLHGWINAKGEEKKDANLMDMLQLAAEFDNDSDDSNNNFDNIEQFKPDENTLSNENLESLVNVEESPLKSAFKSNSQDSSIKSVSIATSMEDMITMDYETFHEHNLEESKFFIGFWSSRFEADNSSLITNY